MKIATYDVNGINGLLPVLLRWLEDDVPDIVCLQDLKSPDERFPRRELHRNHHPSSHAVSARADEDQWDYGGEVWFEVGRLT